MGYGTVNVPGVSGPELESVKAIAQNAKDAAAAAQTAAGKALSAKQDKLTGQPGQVVGFDKDGKAVAQDAPSTGVTSFNGRTGAIVPAAGDYTAGQVGAAPANHTHPAPTSVAGNAGTATKLAATKTIDGVAFDGSTAISHYGTCSVAADSGTCVVELPGFSLVPGARIAVKFTNNTDELSTPTLNVNNTGAKPIYIAEGTVGRCGIWGAGKVVEFLYDGSKWLVKGSRRRYQ